MSCSRSHHFIKQFIVQHLRVKGPVRVLEPSYRFRWRFNVTPNYLLTPPPLSTTTHPVRGQFGHFGTPETPRLGVRGFLSAICVEICASDASAALIRAHHDTK
uniref:Uncharacterized protein n=1 Tax=Ananas comosus var. bracteatus TaxID=296719 RepID=A0A6V7QSX8_ANACO